MSGRVLLLLGCAVFAGCATTPRDPLERMHPYLFAEAGELRWFTCRWQTDEPIGYALLGTDEAETRQVRRVLDVWEEMGLGLRFVEVPPSGAQLTLVAVDASVKRDDGSQGAGRSITDCRLHEEGGEPRAELVKARVEVARSAGPGPLGRLHPLDANAWLGVWAHEIGHALGYQGHLRRGDDPMRLEPDHQRFIGARIRNGAPVVSPAVRALYARPSGSLLGTATLPERRTHDLDEIHALARRADAAGPFLRSGDRSARIYWETAKGRQYGFLVLDFPGVLKEPGTIVFLPEAPVYRELR